ncbi:MAG: nucleoside phosphorylase [Bacteroidales bacterium]|jgi:uridine phosphorylase|nr:nucleoside phosphorylase [Bacteroidales bacterium]
MKALSEMPLTADGAVYHIGLLPEDITDKIVLVGDPGRVGMISSKFDTIIKKTRNREIESHIGRYKGVPITVMSTGMGVDNVDIVLNELNILANVDFKTKELKGRRRKLQFVRIGTCGAFQPNIPVNSHVASEYAIGIDGMLYYYDIAHIMNPVMEREFIRKMRWSKKLPYPYVVKGGEYLLNHLDSSFIKTITVTTPSFYGGQGREVTLPLAYPHLNQKLMSISVGGKKLGNFEMETSALYGLSAAMGHEALTVCLVIANRYSKTSNFSYHTEMKELIDKILNFFITV